VETHGDDGSIVERVGVKSLFIWVEVIDLAELGRQVSKLHPGSSKVGHAVLVHVRQRSGLKSKLLESFGN
jgi:hypothetical protein